MIGCALVVLLGITAVVHASPMRAHATRRTSTIEIDGTLDEAAWTTASVHTGFTQRAPKDGVKAQYDTRFAVMFDDKALYIGVWADDPEPDKIVSMLSRRDFGTPSDEVAIAIDSYHDRRTAYVFQVNAAGVQRDSIIFDDKSEDSTWDAVWTGAAGRGDRGWTAEMRIPLNQLRFSDADAEWGMQVIRIVTRTQEQTAWSPWPRSAPEMVSNFGVIDGLGELRPGRRLELLPYVTGGVEVMPVDSADPFSDGTNGRGGVGLDVKYGLSNAFTLSATINPDFGQVEADPSQVNLSANELFFAEKRPFFLEGVELFKLPIGNSDNAIEGAFYSRRIGAAPPTPNVAYDYIEIPTATTIYGAMKLTGKTRSGWSVGILDAVTGEETARIADGADRESLVAAPLSNYALARIKRDFRDGRTSIGMHLSAVHRSLDDDGLAARFHDQAYTAGTTLQHRWGRDGWEANITLLGSLVHGSEEAIAQTQQLQRHLYQRPDATNAHFDPTRTSLVGWGTTFKIGTLGDTPHWRYGVGGDMRTIGLELNDLGFQTTSDRFVPFVFGEYHDNDPGESVLNWSANADFFTVSTLEPYLTDYGVEYGANVTLANYWSLSANGSLANTTEEPSMLRGGPRMEADPTTSYSASVSSDGRLPIQVSVGGHGGYTWNQKSISGGVDLSALVRPIPNVELSIGPSFNDSTNQLQYVDEVQDSSGTTHYIVGRIRQTTASLTMRLNWAFTPHLALQAYAQPFVATGRYSELKDIDRPHADTYEDRFTRIDDYTLSDNAYTVMTPSGASYQVGRPDFTLGQLRSTVVVRWEYRPGSNLFAIWSHGQTDETADGRFRLDSTTKDLLRADAEDTVMLKLNYWIGL